MQRGNHAILKFQKPFLHLTPGFGGGNDIQQLHHLTLTAFHVGDVQHVGEYYISNAFKALLQMWLDPGGEQGEKTESGICEHYSISDPTE